MYNLRYHIASLVGVFLALSIGLLLGTIVAERGTLDAQRDTLINSLERDFADLSQSNTDLAAENEAQGAFIGALVPKMVEGSLEGQTVAVLTNAGRSDGTAAVQDAIKQAGGVPITIVLEKPGLGLEQSDVMSAVKPYLGDAASSAAVETVAKALASEWTTAGPRPVTDALAKAGVMRATELTPQTAVDSLVFTAAWDAKPDVAGVEIGRAVWDLGRKAVGAQAVSLDTGVAAAALDRGLDAVDRMGEPDGAYTLAWLLAGRATGYYGTGAGAVGAYPAP